MSRKRSSLFLRCASKTDIDGYQISRIGGRPSQSELPLLSLLRCGAPQQSRRSGKPARSPKQQRFTGAELAHLFCSSVTFIRLIDVELALQGLLPWLEPGCFSRCRRFGKISLTRAVLRIAK